MLQVTFRKTCIFLIMLCSRSIIQSKVAHDRFSVSLFTLTRSSVFKSLTNLRVLLYVTSHLSLQHFQALQWMWPETVANSDLLKSSEVIFYVANQPPVLEKLLKDAFPTNSNVTVVNYTNDGYQEGAIKALSDAYQNNWFKEYDWVIRVNPDVIIRNDTWILKQMFDKDVWGVLVDCLDHRQKRPKVHTDFFAIRPEHLINQTCARDANLANVKNAEQHATVLFENIWSSDHGKCLTNIKTVLPGQFLS